MSQVAHLWVESALGGNPCKPLKKNTGQGSNFWWEGDTIYSYGRHFPIAKVVQHKKKRAVLFTTRTYSVTTSGHISEVAYALRGRGAPVFNVPGQLEYMSKPNGPEMRLHYSSEAMKAFESAKKAIKRGYQHIQSGLNFLEEGNRMAVFFGWKWRLKVPASVKKIEEQVKARTEKVQASARKRFSASADWWESYYGAWTRHESPEKCQRPLGIVDEYKLQRAGIEFVTRLRVNGDKVETSRGAEVPLSHAKRLMGVINKVKASGVEYVRNGHTEHVGDFAVDFIKADGSLKAGCHYISAEEISRFEKVLAEA